MKTCNKCLNEKEWIYFSPDKRNKDGLQSRCKECCNSIRSNKYKENESYRNKQKNHQKKYYKQANERAKRHVEKLSDFYLIASLKRGTNLTTKDIKKHPHLIKAKRQIIINKRLCKELKT